MLLDNSQFIMDLKYVSIIGTFALLSNNSATKYLHENDFHIKITINKISGINSRKKY